MSPRHQRVIFKPYIQNQPSLLPASLEELIPQDHLVRVVNQVLDQLAIEPLLKKYKGGGTSSFHPRMLLKVLVYAYCEKIYASRRIAKALRENIHLMWLSGNNRPDFRTINRFRGEVMKDVIGPVFLSVLEYLVDGGYIKLEHYFVDGTKIEANANKHKVVWAKRTKKEKARLQQKVQDLLAEIERVNEAENQEYGDKDLEELGGNGNGLDAEQLAHKIQELNQRLAQTPEDQPLQKAVQKLSQDYLPRQQKYEEQERKLAGRNSYSKTDEDATCMRMKEDRGAAKTWSKPAYNLQVGTEGQYMVGYSLHQRNGDTLCLIPHLEWLRRGLGRLPKQIIADAAYGSEENYAYLEQHQLGNYLKYNTFYQDTHRHYKPELVRKALFQSDHFPYQEQKDEFICPAGKPLTYQGSRVERSDNGYPSVKRQYECQTCGSCAWKAECTKAKGNRRIRVSFVLRRYRTQAKENLLSETGKQLRARRSVEVESVFGHIKYDRSFRRFLLRGLKKVEIEWGLVSIAHNLKKLAA